MTEDNDRAIALLQDAQRQWDERQGRDPPLTDDDVQEILAAIGDDAPFPEFRALADANKHRLFRKLLRVRRALEQFDLLDEELAEDTAPLMSALQRIGEVVLKSPATLTRLATEMSATRATSFEEEFVEMIELAVKAKSMFEMLEAAKKASGKPMPPDRRRMQALRRQFEAGLIYRALTTEGIAVPLTDASPGLAFAARLVAYTCRKENGEGSGRKSRTKTSPGAFRRQLSQYFRSRRGKGRFKKKVS